MTKTRFKYAEPLVCFIAMLVLLGACSSKHEEGAQRTIAAPELAARLGAGSPPLIVDVRSAEEYSLGHIPGAINIPHDELSGRIAELYAYKSDEIVVHCQSGRRAQLAEAVLAANGFSNVRDLNGHWQAWQALELPVARD